MELPIVNERNYDSGQHGGTHQQHDWPSHSHPVVVNVDVFFKNLYNFHYHRGLAAILLTEMCKIINLGFTVGFSIFLIVFLDWSSLMQCHDESTCHHLGAYIILNPFRHGAGSALLLILYMILCLGFWVWRFGEATQAISSAIEMDQFYREKLGFGSDIQNLRWNEVLHRVIELHDQRQLQGVGAGGHVQLTLKDKLTEHDVVSRIMRKENYMVAFINKELLNLRSPWWLALFVGSDSLILTSSLEWALSYCILDHMFHERAYTISNVFLKDRQGLQWRFVMVGAVHFVLLPFLLVFMVVHFFLQNAQEYHASKTYLGPRRWSPLALWTFREFNELPHVFEERINRSIAPTNQYIELFKNPHLALLARCAAYISGAVVATLLVVSFIDEGILLYVQALDHNLLWYLGVFTAIFAGSRSMIPEDPLKLQAKLGAPHHMYGAAQSEKDPEELVKVIGAHTHHSPKAWVGKCHTEAVFSQISEMFPYRLHIFAMEIYSVVITPIVLCFSLPDCVDNIIDFVREHTRYIDGVGSVLDYSTFECFDAYGDPTFGAAPTAANVDPRQKAMDGKMEKSFMNFHAANPQWQPRDPGGRAVIQNLRQFKEERVRQRDDLIASVLHHSVVMGGGRGRDQGQGQSAFVGGRYDNAGGADGSMGSGGSEGMGAPGRGTGDGRGHPQPTNENYHAFSNAESAAAAAQGGNVDPSAAGRASPTIQMQSSDANFDDSSGINSPLLSQIADEGGGRPGDVIHGQYDSLDALAAQAPAGQPVQTLQEYLPGDDSAAAAAAPHAAPQTATPAPAPTVNANTAPRNAGGTGSSGRLGGNAVPPPMPPSLRLQRNISSGLYYGSGGAATLSGIGFGSTARSAYASSSSSSSDEYRDSSGGFLQGQLNSILRSVLKEENIDYENDFYWMDMLQREKQEALAQSQRVQGGVEQSAAGAGGGYQPRIGRSAAGTAGNGVGSNMGNRSGFGHGGSSRGVMRGSGVLRARNMQPQSQQYRGRVPLSPEKSRGHPHGPSHQQSPQLQAQGQGQGQGQRGAGMGASFRSTGDSGMSAMGSFFNAFGSQLNVIWEGGEGGGEGRPAKQLQQQRSSNSRTVNGGGGGGARFFSSSQRSSGAPASGGDASEQQRPLLGADEEEGDEEQPPQQQQYHQFQQRQYGPGSTVPPINAGFPVMPTPPAAPHAEESGRPLEQQRRMSDLRSLMRQSKMGAAGPAASSGGGKVMSGKEKAQMLKSLAREKRKAEAPHPSTAASAGSTAVSFQQAKVPRIGESNYSNGSSGGRPSMSMPPPPRAASNSSSGGSGGNGGSSGPPAGFFDDAPTPVASSSSGSGSSGAAGLPAGFFDNTTPAAPVAAPAPVRSTVSSTAARQPTARAPAGPSTTPAVATAAAASSLPVGFFDDSEADFQARGLDLHAELRKEEGQLDAVVADFMEDVKATADAMPDEDEEAEARGSRGDLDVTEASIQHAYKLRLAGLLSRADRTGGRAVASGQASSSSAGARAGPEGGVAADAEVGELLQFSSAVLAARTKEDDDGEVSEGERDRDGEEDEDGAGLQSILTSALSSRYRSLCRPAEAAKVEASEDESEEEVEEEEESGDDEEDEDEESEEENNAWTSRSFL